MSLLRLDGLHREIGPLVILDSVSASLARGERVGLVGANGAGKTTLLRIVAGSEEPDGGAFQLGRDVRLGLLAQEANLDPLVASSHSVRSLVRSGAAEVETMERQLAEMEASGATAVQSPAYAALRERFEARDGYHLDQRVTESLAGLGIPKDRWERRPTELSGGEQTRVALARLIVADPDLLLLDEPTNHLDISALEWLEAALLRRHGALIVASHDRAFLDGVVTRIWELRDRGVTSFRGGYSTYLVQREATDARRRRDEDTAAAAIGRERELVQLYRSQRKHVKMHEHERRLERLQAGPVTLPRARAALTLPGQADRRSGSARSGDVVISLEDTLCGFRSGPGREVHVPVARIERLEARRGERIGLVGPNGAGKTTLLRTLAGQLPALSGFVRLGANVQAAYLSQLRDASLPGSTVLDAMLAAAPGQAGAARSHLARFLFRGDDVFKPVNELSGGERSRLELALLGIGDANLLLLDEPTNHLDIPAREALETFLRGSSATLLVVSHDRRLLETVCERLWVVAPGPRGAPSRVAPFEGGYRLWRAAVGEGWTAEAALAGRMRVGASRESRATDASASNGAPPRDSHGTARRSERPPLSKDAYRRARARIDDDLARLGARRGDLEAALAGPSVQSNFVELRRLSSELADVDGALSLAEDAWLTLADRAPR